MPNGSSSREPQIPHALPRHDLNMPHKINALGELVECPPNCPVELARAPRHFRSCPACRGSGKLEFRCAICAGRGDVSTDEHGNMETAVTDGAKRLLEAARVAVLPTNEFQAMKANFQNEAIEWALLWLTNRARNMQATQDYVGEHRLNAAVILMRNDWKDEHPDE